MKLTITQAHNDKSLELLQGTRYDITGECPTALAFCEAKGLEVGSVGVGYSAIVDRKTRKNVAIISYDLEKAIRGFTIERPRAPVLGTFEITTC